MDQAHAEGRQAERLAHYGKPKLLVIDELGCLPFEKSVSHLLFQLVVQRYEKKATLITTNQLVTRWSRVSGDKMMAAALLDRLLHHSHTLVIRYRMREKRRAGRWSPPTNGSCQHSPHCDARGVRFRGA